MTLKHEGEKKQSSPTTEPYLISEDDQPNTNLEIEPDLDDPETVAELEKLEEDSQNPETFSSIFSDNDLKQYFREIGQIPLLEQDEEAELLKAIETDRATIEKLRKKRIEQDLSQNERIQLETHEQHLYSNRKRLSQANTRLVVSIAKGYIGRGVEFLDLIQDGNEGLMKAVDRFDRQKGKKFSTYASWWIRQAISKAVADTSRTIRLPVHFIEKLTVINRIFKALEQKLGREPTLEEIADAYEGDVPAEQIQEMLQHNAPPLSLEKPIHEGSSRENSFANILHDPEGEPEPQTQEAEQREILLAALSKIPEREANILMWRNGLDDGEEYTLEEIGKALGITRERVRQLEAQALNRLRRNTQIMNLSDN